jgi:hypothetical protein
MNISRSAGGIVRLAATFLFLAASPLRAAVPEFVLAADGVAQAVIVPTGASRPTG